MNGIVKVVPRTTPGNTPVRTPVKTPTGRSTVQIIDDTVEKTPERSAISFLTDVSSQLDNIFTSPQRGQNTSAQVTTQVTAQVTSQLAPHLQPKAIAPTSTTHTATTHTATTPTATTPTATTPTPSTVHTPSTQVKAVPAPHLNTPMRVMGREYTDEEINSMITDDYFNVPRNLWKYIPIGSHIRVFKTADICGSSNRGARFRPGGYVKSHMTRETEHIIILETALRGKEETGNIVFPMSTRDIDEIWKKTDRASYIEITMMNVALKQKNSEIKTLKSRVDQMEKILKVVVDKIMK